MQAIKAKVTPAAGARRSPVIRRVVHTPLALFWNGCLWAWSWLHELQSWKWGLGFRLQCVEESAEDLAKAHLLWVWQDRTREGPWGGCRTAWQKLVLSFYGLGFRDRTQADRLGGRYLHLLSHLTSPFTKLLCVLFHLFTLYLRQENLWSPRFTIPHYWHWVTPKLIAQSVLIR